VEEGEDEKQRGREGERESPLGLWRCVLCPGQANWTVGMLHARLCLSLWPRKLFLLPASINICISSGTYVRERANERASEREREYDEASGNGTTCREVSNCYSLSDPYIPRSLGGKGGVGEMIRGHVKLK